MNTTTTPGMNQDGLFTFESLSAYAEEQRAIYEELLAQHPAGSRCEGRYRAYQNMNAALLCAEWLQRSGSQSTRFVGPFSARTYRQGERVRVTKGTRIYSSKPGTGKFGDIAQRNHVITVHRFNEGFIGDMSTPSDGACIRHAQVTWLGAGSYWRWTDAVNIEPVE